MVFKQKRTQSCQLGKKQQQKKMLAKWSQPLLPFHVILGALSITVELFSVTLRAKGMCHGHFLFTSMYTAEVTY